MGNVSYNIFPGKVTDKVFTDLLQDAVNSYFKDFIYFTTITDIDTQEIISWDFFSKKALSDTTPYYMTNYPIFEIYRYSTCRFGAKYPRREYWQYVFEKIQNHVAYAKNGRIKDECLKESYLGNPNKNYLQSYKAYFEQMNSFLVENHPDQAKDIFESVPEQLRGL
jgi:hypothetical protein